MKQLHSIHVDTEQNSMLIFPFGGTLLVSEVLWRSLSLFLLPFKVSKTNTQYDSNLSTDEQLSPLQVRFIVLHLILCHCKCELYLLEHTFAVNEK